MFFINKQFNKLEHRKTGSLKVIGSSPICSTDSERGKKTSPFVK